MKETQGSAVRRVGGCGKEVWREGQKNILEKLRGGEISNSGVKVMGLDTVKEVHTYTVSPFLCIQT